MSPPKVPAGFSVAFTQEMRAWVCDECGRLLGTHDDAWVKRLRRRLKHKFGDAPDEGRLHAADARFGEISEFAYSILWDFIQQPKSGLAMSGDVDHQSLEAAVAARFSEEESALIRTLVGWAVVWGYLR